MYSLAKITIKIIVIIAKNIKPIIHVFLSLPLVKLLIKNPDRNAIKTGIRAYSGIHVDIPKMTWLSVSHKIPMIAPFQGPRASPKTIKTA
ncbi:Uncharacterised protein [Mycoplasmopsis arginini]|nr:Uncharacterised protein [Chlamydia abortus]SGA10033.1 Uncharacterised protein [Mycoplasmopsis arginini]SGA19606.1 Uncharacterised protein [Mycoplasmopsis arginini]SGA32376.1 Uncharacterised protein [Chlamydia abortus]